MKRSANQRPMEILMVEDSSVFAKITIGALRLGKVEHHMTWLSDGQEAVQFLYRWGQFRQAPRPDLILLDLGLPKVDGRDLLAMIKTDDNLSDIPVVVMTASTDPDDAAMSRIYEVEAHLTKPVDLGKFLGVVRELQRFWSENVIVPVSESIAANP